MLDLLIQWSYLGIIVFLILTGCGLPIPEEVAIVLAGVLSAQGTMDTGLALASCLIGAILGDSVIYAIGYHWGHSLLKDHPRFAHLLHAEREEKFEEVIQNHGLKVLFLARFMVGIRAPIYLAAGVVRIPYRRFLLMDLFCASLVVTVFFSIAYFFGQPALKWIKNLEMGVTAIAVTVAAAVAVYFFYRRRKKRIARAMFDELKEEGDSESGEEREDRGKAGDSDKRPEVGGQRPGE